MESIEKKPIIENEQKPNKFTSLDIYFIIALFILAIASLSFNQYQLNKLNHVQFTAPKTISVISQSNDALSVVISSGVPTIYGDELGVSFDRVQASIDIMSQLDPGYGKKKIVLQDADKERYIKIGSLIACEYCFGATTLVDKKGAPACGCAHSWAMRGLAAYLIKNHPEMLDDEILRELAKWKGMYFPKQMIQKMTAQVQSGQYTPDIAALLLGSNISDVKGASIAPTDLPNMVGGC